MIKITIAAIWLTFGLLAAGGVNAQYRHDPNRSFSPRQDCAFAYVWGIMGGPITFIVAAGVTGFFEDGLSYSCSEKGEAQP
jgi:hypothetical protein